MPPPLLLRLLVAAAVVFVTVPCRSCSATAAIGLGRERPEGNSTNCDDLPVGYCHRRTRRDRQFVEEWKENKRKKLLLLAAAAAAAVQREKTNDDDNSPFHRRHLVDVQEAPSLPFAPGEYEPIEGILLAYDYWDMDVVAGIAAAVTRQETYTKVYMVVDTVYSYTGDDKADAMKYFINAGVNITRVVWIREPIDAVWIRDYGPRYICHNETKVVRGGVDTKYYTDRPYDDTLPTKLGNGNDIGLYTNYDLNGELIHSGGNGHYFSTRKAFATRLVVTDNVITEAQIKTYWNDYTGAELHLFPQLSFSVDGTGHIDMWFLPVNDTAVIIGQWAREDAYGSKKITDDAARYMTNLGYTVYRTPNQVKNWVHYTYTNAVIANKVVILSKFGVAEDATALVVFKTAFPGHTIVQVDSSNIIQRSGALHCIAQHVYDCAKSNPKTSKPISTPPSPKPTSVKPTTRPTTTKPSAKPTTAPTAKKPTSSKPSTAKPSTRKPTTVKPSARPSTAKPSTANL